MGKMFFIYARVIKCSLSIIQEFKTIRHFMVSQHQHTDLDIVRRLSDYQHTLDHSNLENLEL